MNPEESTSPPNPNELDQETREEAPTSDPLDAIEQERDELKDRYQRAIAEQENLRKRHQRELQETRKFGVSNLAKDILDVLDNLQRALQGIPEGQQEDPIYQGVRLVQEQLEKTLTNHGVKPIDALSQPFDPMLHNAVMRDERDDVEPGTVTEELARGYTLGERLLRAAVVKVAAEKNTGGSSKPEPSDEPAPTNPDGAAPES